MTESELKEHLDAAEKSPQQIAAAVSGLLKKTLRYKPSPDKWCILEILGHLADMEVLDAYRIRQGEKGRGLLGSTKASSQTAVRSDRA